MVEIKLASGIQIDLRKLLYISLPIFTSIKAIADRSETRVALLEFGAIVVDTPSAGLI